MIQALNIPYSSKRDEIMSRYRPIAPKPELSNGNNAGIEAQLVPEKFRQSPYLRDIWSHLQARPTRTRKRGRTAGISPAAAAAMLRNQQHQQQQQQQHEKMLGFMGLPSHASNLTYHACGIYGSDQHAHYNYGNNSNNNDVNESIIELPLLSTTPLLNGKSKSKGKSIDLNTIDEINDFEQKDYLSLKLQIPTITTTTTTSYVISPRPVRPVGSIISIVGPIGEDPESGPIENKSAEKVEEEAEKEMLPAVISDRGNKVRMVNSAYKELIGQPECPWLDSMVSSWGSGSRISGEVMIRFGGGNGKQIPGSGNGFSCWVRIEWESKGEKKYVNAFSEVMRLGCESKDYGYYWRFHTREISPSASIV